MTPARVFLVVWWFDRLGGMERHVTDLAIALQSRGIAVTVFSEQPLARSNQYARMLRAAAVTLVAPPRIVDAVAKIEHGRLYRALSRRTGAGAKTDQHLSQALLLQAMARQAGFAPPSVVHLHGCRLGQQAVLRWAAARHYPTVYTEHTTISDWGGPFDAHAPRVIGDIADVLACVSEHSRRSMLACLPRPRDIAVTRHIIADPRDAVPAPDRTPARVDRPVRLLAVGRLAAHKGYATLLAALGALRADGGEFHLRIAGGGNQLGELVALRAKLALTDCVTFLGQVDQADIGGLWQAADIGVMPSLSEGLPLSLVEAMAQSKPIVATRVGGIPEVICDGQNGLLVDAGDAAALAGAIGRIIADPALAQHLAEGARRSFEAGSWSTAAVVAQHLALYEMAAQTQSAKAALAAETGDAWHDARMRELAVPIRRATLCIWRVAAYGMMEAALCRQALALARAGVAVTLLVECPIGARNAYIRRMQRGGVRVIAPSRFVSLTHRLAARAASLRPGRAIPTPLTRAFATECAVRKPDVVHIYGWQLGAGWSSLGPVLENADNQGIASVYSEHAGAPLGEFAAKNALSRAPSARVLSASSAPALDLLRAATDRAVTLTHCGEEARPPVDSARITDDEPVLLLPEQPRFAAALAEAMAAAKPIVICGRTDALPVRNRVDCLVTGDNATGALAMLHATPDLARQIAQGARQTYERSGLRDYAILAETIGLYRAACNQLGIGHAGG